MYSDQQITQQNLTLESTQFDKNTSIRTTSDQIEIH